MKKYVTKLKSDVTKIIASAVAFITILEAKANYMVMSTDAFTLTDTATNNLKTKLINLAGGFFPLAILLSAIAMLFTRDPKKFDIEYNLLKGFVIAYILVIFVTKGAALVTIENLFNLVTS